MADDQKSLSIPEALHGLYKGLTEQVKDWEQKCLDLRKAELEKKSPPGRKEEVEKLKAKGLPASEAFGIAWKQHNAEAKKGEVEPAQPPLAGNGDGMQMSEDDKLDAYAKGELKFKKNFGNPAAYGPGGEDMPKSESMCKGTPMCKCTKCEGMDRYAKGETSMAKVTPAENREWESMKQDAGVKGYAAGTGPHPKKPSTADKQWAAMKRDATKKGELPAGASPDGPQKDEGVLPGDKKSKEQATKSNAGAGGEIVKKAALQTSAPSAAGSHAATPGAPGGGMPKPAGMPKLPAVGGAPKLPGAGAPAAGPKLPGVAKPAAAPKPMAAGAPAVKSEMKKAVTPPHAGPFAARAEASGKVGMDPTFSAHAPGGPAPSPFSQPPAIPAQARVISSAPAPVPARQMAPVVSSAPAPKPNVAPAKLPAKSPATPPPLPADALQAPPAHARPSAAITLPGAHLFGAKPSTPKVK